MRFPLNRFILPYCPYRLIYKEINNTCNYFKGHGEQFHVFCEKWFPGRVKMPTTRVLGGARFDGIFEACVGNFWKRPEIMKWLVYALAIPNNDSIMQHALFIILRSVQMIAQLRVGSIFFLLFLFRSDVSLLTPIFWNIGSGERRTWLVPLIVFTISL